MLFSESDKELMRDDLSRWGVVSLKSHLKTYFGKNGYKLIFRLRVCQALRNTKFKILYHIARHRYNNACKKCNCSIPSSVKIGGGIKIHHPISIIINSDVKLGTHVTIVGSCLIGGTDKGVPIIGNNVLIGGNATIVGGVSIGDNAKIGAGALVVHNVENGKIAISPSAHIIEAKEED